MLFIPRRSLTLLISLYLLTTVFANPENLVAQVPQEISDKSFWAMVEDFSEPGGFFRADNFVSNEIAFQYVIPELSKNGEGGVYLGVGPDQNFTYIVALRPQMAFIIDIRRQNMLEHLMYKALIELSSDRVEFLSKLFSRPRPGDLSTASTADELLSGYKQTEPAANLFDENLQAIFDQLTLNHRFDLSVEDKTAITYVYRAFYRGGPFLTYSGANFNDSVYRRMPTYADLMIADDGEGLTRSYLATEENFLALQQMQKKNLIVPLVGDFAGPKTIRAVGAYLTEHGAAVKTIYTSNVEQYLFQEDSAWRAYYTNVSTLPLEESSTFIRSVFNMGGFRYRTPAPTYGIRSMNLLSNVSGLVRAFLQGEIASYFDVIQMSK